MSSVDNIKNVRRLVAPFVYMVSSEDDVLDIDTSGGLGVLYIPNIVSHGLLLTRKPLYINDVSGNASVNPITILTLGGDTINNLPGLILDSNGVSAQIIISDRTRYIANFSNDGDEENQSGSFIHNAYIQGDVNYIIPTVRKPRQVLVWCVSNELLTNTGLPYKTFGDPAFGNLGSYHGVSRGQGFPDDYCTCYYYQEDVPMEVSGGFGTRDYMPVLFEPRFVLEIAFRDSASTDSGIYGNITNFQANSFDFFVGIFGTRRPITTINWVAFF